MSLQSNLISASALLCLLITSSEAPAELYRWVDETGRVQYSDRIPPTAIDKAHVELSNEGAVIRTIDPVKSAEEVRREQELQRLRDERAELLERQRAADRLLLRTYRSVDDLMMMRDGKLAAIDVMIQSTKGNIRRQQNRLNRLQADAANLERVGKPVHPALIRDVTATENGIEDDLGAILRHERAKQDIYEKFAAELERFRRLKDIQATPQEVAQEAQPMQLDNLIVCTTPAECDQLWRQAVSYVETHATMPVESSSDKVMLTLPPTSDEDISLIVSRIRDKTGGGTTIFLDLQCASYTATVSSCRTPARVVVLKGFRSALNNAP
ncbi:DUF4124 domain-containing protein [Thiospirillum jenense]|uniref:DUF4124 domain-containing protein n=1 Tax=Thiospirillum jenense TaxID=1653858 RepID=A0A839HD23_9GAMM|nr:DUF4124 domain-containing protein [Thiospirillum jenense]MBB1126414.1 DUF4124 domain-containing protein [Thiospirillum jenense]